MIQARKRFDVWTNLSLIIFIFYILFLALPLFTMLFKSFYDGNTGELSLAYFTKFFSKPYYLNALWNSMKVTVCVTLLAALIATPLAYIMSTVKIKGSSAIQILILISSMSAPFIGAYSWILLLGRNGVITRFFKDTLGIAMPDIYGFTGILLVLTLQMVPLIFMYVSGALKNVDQSLMEAAESMGYKGFAKMRKVLLPLITPTLLAGGLLVFMRALADFGTPMLIGEGYKTVPVLIFTEFISEVGGDDGFAAAISVIVVLFATAVFLLQKFVANRKSYTMSALNPIEAKKKKGIGNVAAHVVIYLYTLLALMPQLYVMYTSFQKTSGRIFVPGYSLDSYRQAFDNIGDVITNTFMLAITAIVIIILLAVLIAYVTVRRRNALTNTLDTFTMFPYIVPGSILGIALLVTFNDKPLILSGTAAIMVIAFVIRRLPYTIRSSAAILHQISGGIEEAAISLGASQMKTFFKITLPMMLAGVVSGAILSWVTIITELSTSIILYTGGTRTMTVAIYTEVVRGNYGVAAALSSILTAITVASLLLFLRMTGKKEFTL
ncbi:iron ABC transporter permease [Cohnella sp. CIP 111063]|jgi:iron(III) transport system permease protein|uniref:ABC transporter permease n=1 Tax=unclassified Cohnella TaxID=2636738 RepID=UPI000B8C41FE|nr:MULTISPECIES: iron ABC transporter permease [unclassified Cohnella]OXS58767.1 iron ABC transporter permease [Cohnella sp. CIP 111063]PRX71846.1 iron(III) transport system permease protein [Cohnella sp. SGD-V74]